MAYSYKINVDCYYVCVKMLTHCHNVILKCCILLVLRNKNEGFAVTPTVLIYQFTIRFGLCRPLSGDFSRNTQMVKGYI
jgi:hypothetical protein